MFNKFSKCILCFFACVKFIKNKNLNIINIHNFLLKITLNFICIDIYGHNA